MDMALTRLALRSAVQRAIKQEWPHVEVSFEVRPARREQGEFCCTAALALAPLLAAQRAQNVRAIAEVLRARLEAEKLWPGAVEEANGFLNFRMDDAFVTEQTARAAREGARFGAGNTLEGKRANIEFVSSDPTGPLTLSAGRIAACGEALCRLLEFQGGDVTREYFVNDVPASSKMRLLGESVGAFYQASFGQQGEVPEGILQDAFVQGVAQKIAQRDGNLHLLEPEATRNEFLAREAASAAVGLQKQTLLDFGVRFDLWTAENMLRTEGRVQSVIEKLQCLGHIYESEGALWLRTTAFGDEHDHPVVRSNGYQTYFASDIAYHVWKFERGFDLVLNIWTAEHRPYVARTRAALQAIGCDISRYETLICEGARLREDGEALEGPDGAPLLLTDALEEVDADTLRLHFLLAPWDQICDIDLEVATRDDERNPAYAARLAPSRLGTMLREAEAAPGGEAPLSEEEKELARLVALWPDTVENAAVQRAPQLVARWTVDFAAAVRRVLASSQPGAYSPQRLDLLRGAQSAISNALRVLGIEVKEQF
jgi:arginyl-tRNA synthetase